MARHISKHLKNILRAVIGEDTINVDFVSKDYVLEGLLQITKGNLGIANQLFDKIKSYVKKDVDSKLKKLSSNTIKEIKNAKARGHYRAKRNLEKSGRYPEWFNNASIHHIVAWGDRRARLALILLLRYGIDPQHEANLLPMPKSSLHVPHPMMPNCVSHSRIHTEYYHEAVFFRLDVVDVPGATQEDILNALREIANEIHQGIFEF